jgi:multicomponent Na+:H+ antiporter subunit E
MIMFGGFFKRIFGFALLWALLTGASWRDPVIATVALLGVTFSSFLLWPSGALKVHLAGLPDLTLYFICNSIRGGLDIAYRALAPSMPLQPGLIEFESRLTDNASLVLFAWLINLMPGTATVRLQDRRLTVHLIDTSRYGEGLRLLEHKVARFLRP